MKDGVSVLIEFFSIEFDQASVDAGSFLKGVIVKSWIHEWVLADT